MIVPQNRLMVWVALVSLPAAGLAAVDPSLVTVGLVGAAVLLGVVLLDVALSLGMLDGLRLTLPAVARFSKDRDSLLEVRVHDDRARGLRLRVGLPLPEEIHSPAEDVWVQLPAQAADARFQWPCRPLRRGCYRLTEAYVEALSPVGFWALRARVPATGEIRVYPNLLPERKSVAALFLNRGKVGIHARRQVGRGREFEKLREYIPGDSFDDVHWKATAKRGHPVTKTYQIERTQEVYVIIDASRLSARAPQGDRPPASRSSAPAGAPATSVAALPLTVLERYVTAALMLGLAAERQGDLYGLMTFTDRVEGFVRARNGKAHYSACRDALYGLQPRIVTPDFDDACSFLRLRLRRRALLVFLTALDDPLLSEAFVRNVELIARQHLVLVNMMRPPGAQPLFADAGVRTAEDLYRHLGGHTAWQNLRELEKVLQHRGVQFALVDNERLSAQLVTQYLGVRARQLL